MSGGFAAWASGAWMDVLMIAAMLSLAALRWWRVKYDYDDTCLRIFSGILSEKHTILRWDRVVSAGAYHRFFLRPLRAVRFRLDTIGGSARKSDLSILFWPAQAEKLMEIMRRRRNHLCKEGCGCNAYSPGFKSIAALSVFTTNSLAGVLFISTFISQAGRIFGSQVPDMFIGRVESMARSFAFGVPPAATAIAVMLLFGWLIGFLHSFSRYGNMRVTRSSDLISITGGILSRREYQIESERITFIDIRQSLITKIFRMFSLYISACGYGKLKDDISCIIPTEGNYAFSKDKALLFYDFPDNVRQYSHAKSAVMRFLATPISLLGLLAGCAWIMILFFPGWRSFIMFVGLMIMAMLLWLLAVKIIDYKTAGVSFDRGHYTFRYSKGFYLHTVVIPAGAVVLTEIRQSFFQRFGKVCDLIVFTKSEGSAPHICRGLSIKQAKLLV